MAGFGSSRICFANSTNRPGSKRLEGHGPPAPWLRHWHGLAQPCVQKKRHGVMDMIQTFRIMKGIYHLEASDFCEAVAME